MPEYSAVARLAADLDMSVPDIEEMIASEAVDLARRERAGGDPRAAEIYDRIAAARWAEAIDLRGRTAR